MLIFMCFIIIIFCSVHLQKFQASKRKLMPNCFYRNEPPLLTTTSYISLMFQVQDYLNFIALCILFTKVTKVGGKIRIWGRVD